MTTKGKIPVTIITGFLGAGKTTFINGILKNNSELKFALVENEFGEVAIDSKLIKGVEASRMFELKNGCICCTISNEYELALVELAEKFPDIDHLLIETTGIADPAPVIRPFFADHHLRNLFHYNGTVCLVDAQNYHRYPAKRIAWKQMAIADLVVITKAENFDEEQKRSIADETSKINPLAKIELADRWEMKNFSLGEIREKSRLIAELIPLQPMEKNIQTQTIRFVQPLNLQTFKDWLTYNLDVYKEQVYRVKGILSFENEPYYFVLQGVGGSFELEESDRLANGKSELVFIGNLQKVDLVYR
jgi:G3E family GTPase